MVADATPFQLHGHLVLHPVRTYNSEGQAHPASEPVGLNWTTSWVSAGERDGLVGLQAPSADEKPTHALAMTGVSATGARELFIPQVLGSAVDLTALGASTGPLAPLQPTTLVVGTGYSRLCVDTSYVAQAGIHVGMWRYLETSRASCSGFATSNAAVLGYGSMSPERVRQEYAADGRLLSVRDAAGNRVDFSYDAANGNRLTSVAEAGSGGRTFSLAYGSWTGPESQSDVQITVTDPAHRLTVYGLDHTSHLVQVANPTGGGTLVYAYGGCTGALSGQLCSASDAFGTAAGHSDLMTYTGGVNGGPARILTARR